MNRYVDRKVTQVKNQHFRDNKKKWTKSVKINFKGYIIENITKTYKESEIQILKKIFTKVCF